MTYESNDLVLFYFRKYRKKKIMSSRARWVGRDGENVLYGGMERMYFTDGWRLGNGVWKGWREFVH